MLEGGVVMRLISSVVFLIGALSVGTYAYFPLHTPSQNRLVDIIHIQDRSAPSAGTASADAARKDMERTFSPGSSVFRAIANAFTTNATRQPRQPGRTAPAAATDARPASQTGDAAVAGFEPQNAWRAVIKDNTQDELRAKAKSDDYMERYELARRLQNELSRVGCYRGDVDGDWGPASKRAATAFLRKVNATLPVETPDYILLTLIQGHADKACGVACPTGQGLASDGRCVPSVIVAQGPKQSTLFGRATLGSHRKQQEKRARTDRTRVARAPITASAQRLQSGVTMDEPASADAARAKAAEATSSVVASKGAESTAGKYDGQVIEKLERPSPLPGKMAVGAPPPKPSEVRAPPLTTRALTPEAAAVAHVPSPTRAPAAPLERRQAKISIDDDTLDSASTVPHATFAPPKYGAAPADEHTRSRAAVEGPATVRAAPHRKVHAAAKAHRPRQYRRGGTVRTSIGRVRRGSPQHNLMLSLGGVF